DKAIPARSLDRSFGKQCPELRVVETGKIGQAGCTQCVARREFCFPSFTRKLVPRADGKAIVAAVDAIADRSSQVSRNRALVLDGEIGNTAARIDPLGSWKGRCWANVKARAAGAATVTVGAVDGQFERGENRAEK